MSDPWDLKASSGAGTECPPAGSFPAICVALVDLGTHQEEYDKTDKEGKKTGQKELKNVRKVFIAWELLGQKLAGTSGLNHVIGKGFSVSTGPKAALRMMLEKWRGKVFADNEDIPFGKILGAKCILTVIHDKSDKGRVYGKIDGVAPPVQGMVFPPSACVPFRYQIKDGAYDPPVWMPQYNYGNKIIDEIQGCHERRTGGQAATTPANQVPQQPAAAPVSQGSHGAGFGTPVAAAVAEDSVPF